MSEVKEKLSPAERVTNTWHTNLMCWPVLCQRHSLSLSAIPHIRVTYQSHTLLCNVAMLEKVFHEILSLRVKFYYCFLKREKTYLIINIIKLQKEDLFILLDPLITWTLSTHLHLHLYKNSCVPSCQCQAVLSHRDTALCHPLISCDTF